MLVQDWDKPEPDSDPRRAKAFELLGGLGQAQGATMDSLLSVLSTESTNSMKNGLLNAGTAFSVVMVPRNATLRSYLRTSQSCC